MNLKQKIIERARTDVIICTILNQIKTDPPFIVTWEWALSVMVLELSKKNEELTNKLLYYIERYPLPSKVGPISC